uniref:Uncharacterized protein n=1 Tax=Arundo donax TaxID=35708 RepID=A0A0A9G294_ARUDO
MITKTVLHHNSILTEIVCAENLAGV